MRFHAASAIGRRCAVEVQKCQGTSHGEDSLSRLASKARRSTERPHLPVHQAGGRSCVFGELMMVSTLGQMTDGIWDRLVATSSQTQPWTQQVSFFRVQKEPRTSDTNPSKLEVCFRHPSRSSLQPLALTGFALCLHGCSSRHVAVHHVAGKELASIPTA